MTDMKRDDVTGNGSAGDEVALHAAELGKRYGRRWALSGCDLAIPAGSVTALVGPNGAGKSTLLNLAAGLARPTAGSIRVLGLDPDREAAALLPRLGFVAQDHPLYGQLSVAETLTLGRKLNPGWDGALAEGRIRQIGLDPEQKVRKLSGGQQAQLALVLALGKRPDLLLLDEPLAALDPVARREAMGVLMDTVADAAETGRVATVVLSSHNVGDIERVCDHLVIVNGGRVIAAGPLDGFRDGHRRLVGPRATEREIAALGERAEIVRATHTDRQTTVLLRGPSPLGAPLAGDQWAEQPVPFEDVVIEYLSLGRDPVASDCREVA
ncbi:MAG TPA: ABC transporter ATP-binding protein [Thermomicrobiales bacterium]|jgi:ABC-2 type transport system ATP-binding protein|nr:ABC transporter ATP-binding protein [Thermomicrobiales bacterium]